MHLYSARFVTELLRVSAVSAVNDDDVVEPPPPTRRCSIDGGRICIGKSSDFVFETECHMSGDGVTRCYLLETEISICDGNYRRLKEQQNARQLNHVSTRCAYTLPPSSEPSPPHRSPPPCVPIPPTFLDWNFQWRRAWPYTWGDKFAAFDGWEVHLPWSHGEDPLCLKTPENCVTYFSPKIGILGYFLFPLS